MKNEAIRWMKTQDNNALKNNLIQIVGANTSNCPLQRSPFTTNRFGFFLGGGTINLVGLFPPWLGTSNQTLNLNENCQ